MTSFNFNTNREQVKKEFNLDKGEYFKPKEGPNKIRLVSECLAHPGEYNGKPTFKWLCQVLDLTDGKVKPYFMPDKIYKDIGNLQLDPDYAFEEVPMPYNINIQTENAGDITVKYTVIPSPKRVPLTPEELAAVEAAPTVQELQKKIREIDGGSEEKNHQEPGHASAKAVADSPKPQADPNEIDTSDIPF